jgi:hypothetical protein
MIKIGVVRGLPFLAHLAQLVWGFLGTGLALGSEFCRTLESEVLRDPDIFLLSLFMSEILSIWFFSNVFLNFQGILGFIAVTEISR